MKRSGRVVLIGVALSLLFLGLALKNVEWGLFIRGVEAFNWAFLPAMVGLVLLDLASRALRWGMLLPESRRNAPGLLFRLETIGLGLNNILPFRLGELGRTYLASQELDLPFVAVLATVFVERVLDGLSLLALFVFAGDWGIESKWITPLKETARIGLSAGAACLFALLWFEGVMKKIPALQSFIGRRPGLKRALEQFVLGTRSLRNWKKGLGVVFFGLILWVWDAALIHVTARAFGAATIGLSRALTVLVSGAAAVSLPGVPGYFGAYELVVSRTLLGFGMPRSVALPCAGFIHLTSYLVTTILGVVFLYREGHSLASLKRALDDKRA